MGVDALRQRYGQLQEYSAIFSATQASLAIATSSDGNVRIVVAKFILSTKGKGFSRFQSGGTGIGPELHVATYGGIALDEPDIAASYGAALNWSSDIAATHSIFIKYYLQGYGS